MCYNNRIRDFNNDKLEMLYDKEQNHTFSIPFYVLNFIIVKLCNITMIIHRLIGQFFTSAFFILLVLVLSSVLKNCFCCNTIDT